MSGSTSSRSIFHPHLSWSVKSAEKNISRVEWLDKVSSLMDNQFRIPFTQIRFGLDFLIGLIPGIGDLFSLAVSGSLILAMLRYGVGGRVLLMMLGNILLDMTVGSVPVLGDIFDLTFKANRRNFELFRRYRNEGMHQGSGCGLILIALLLLGGIFAFAIWGLVRLMAWVLA
ncbi:MAG: DUF4112 domain-containing protein [Saprospirales bacterium]|nr:DUF4112 domain-containing protein [Saprospirales bacterium]